MAHQAGASDPKSYALLLERVGLETRDAGYSSHWLSEAANVWSTTLGDAHRAARVLMQAIDRDPTQRTAADRLAQLYRDKGDYKALVALLERRAKALATVAPQSPEIRTELAEMHEELARLWNDNLQQPKKAQENLRRARELRDPAGQVANLREAVAALRDAGDLVGATRALEQVRAKATSEGLRRRCSRSTGRSSSSASPRGRGRTQRGARPGRCVARRSCGDLRRRAWPRLLGGGARYRSRSRPSGSALRFLRPGDRARGRRRRALPRLHHR